MAIDNSPPRLKLIVTIAAITVVTLLSLNFVFESYYAYMSDDAARSKIAPTLDREAQRKAEQVALTNAALPIDQAIAQFTKGDRPALITPQPSDDMGPLTGWSRMPKPLPPPSHGTKAGSATHDAPPPGTPVPTAAPPHPTGAPAGTAPSSPGGPTKPAPTTAPPAPKPAPTSAAPPAPKPTGAQPERAPPAPKDD